MDRATTPLSCQLLTPPHTGYVDKQVCFTNITHVDANSKHTVEAIEGEFSTSYLDGIQAHTSTELGGECDYDLINTVDETCVESPLTDGLITSDISSTEERILSTPVDIEVGVTAPTTFFPFLDLPVIVRQQVYEILLVIPALICVRQKHTPSYDEKKAYICTERREYLPGIAYALPQLTVNGFKTRFGRFATTNTNILLASKEVFAEAKVVMYSKNHFELIKPSIEMTPSTDFSIRLFPSGCQRFVTKLNFRIRSFYGLNWLLRRGYKSLKHFYRGLETVTFFLELESAIKGFGKRWARHDDENRQVYLKRLQSSLVSALFGTPVPKKAKIIPNWISLCVVFSGDNYMEKLFNSRTADSVANRTGVHTRQNDLCNTLVEAWELLKKGGRRLPCPDKTPPWSRYTA